MQKYGKVGENVDDATQNKTEKFVKNLLFWGKKPFATVKKVNEYQFLIPKLLDIYLREDYIIYNIKG